MKDMLSKMAKSDQKPDDNYDAKMQVLNELRDMAMGMMGDKVKDRLPGMKSVEVSAPDKAGLAKGLDMAKSLAEGNGSPMDAAAMDVAKQHSMGRNEPSGDQGEPDQSMPNADDDDMDMAPDEIDEMIAHLQAKKAALGSKSDY